MTEPNSKAQRLPADPGEPPEDIATLYSWANLHGAKYRDFSSSRAEAREEARVRAEEARAAEQRRLDEEAERKAQEEAQIAARLAAEAAEAARQAEAERLAEIARQAEAERQAVLTAQEAQRLAAQQRAWQPMPQMDQSAEPLQQQVQQRGAQPGPQQGPQPAQEILQPKSSDEDSGSPLRAAHFLNGFLNQTPEAFQGNDPGPAQLPPSTSNTSNTPNGLQRPFGPFAVRPDPFAPISASMANFQNPPQAQNSARPFPPAISSAQSYAGQSYFGAPENAVYNNSDINQTHLNQQSVTQVPADQFLNSRYQPEPFYAPNYVAPPQSAPAYKPFEASLQSNARPTDPSSNSDKPLSAPPYRPQVIDTYSPWQPPLQRETPQELYDQRESLSRPAWLIPELVAESPVPETPAPSVARGFRQPSPAQAQYSAGTMPSPKPEYSYQQPQAAQPPAPSPLPGFGVPVVGFPTQPLANNPLQTQSLQTGYPENSTFRPGLNPQAMMGQSSGLNQSPSEAPNHDFSQQSSGVADNPLTSRDRVSQRWYALKSVFDPQSAVEQASVQPPARVPALAVFSLAGGVGKTSIVAALGRALSSRGERVLLVDTAIYGLLPFFFGARDQRPGMLRTFNPPGVSADAPIQLVTLDPDGHASDSQIQSPQDQNQDWLPQEIGRYSRQSSRILIDLPTASGATTRRVLKLAPAVLVPVVPDMSSVVSVGAIESFFRHSAGASGSPGQSGPPTMPFYVLNQFDYSLPLHLDVREILREQIGDRLLPFALRRNPAISEALAEGMTVMDYAPTATVAEDYASLAGWVRSISAPANVSHRGVRWSER